SLHQDAVWASLPRGNCGVDGRSFTCYECPHPLELDKQDETDYNNNEPYKGNVGLCGECVTMTTKKVKRLRAT
ncbi:MAG: hypothetical protein JW892_15930, partial [Anaerolineae bacterium]|nr:hypothetical protein [Anaerolineae bacterium]